MLALTTGLLYAVLGMAAVGGGVGGGVGVGVGVGTDTRAQREAVVAADRAHAAASASSLLRGFPSALADDAVFLFPGQPIAHGRDAAASLLAALPDAARQTMTWYPVRVDVSADGTRGYTYGYGERVGPSGAGGSRPATTHLKYIAYWRRDGAGRWRVAAWAFSAGAAGAPRVPPAGCESPTREYGRDVATAHGGGATSDRGVLLRVDADFSARSLAEGAAEAFGSYVADDGAMLGGAGAEVVCGRAAVRAQFSSFGPGALVWQPRIADLAPSGDLGFTVGVATARVGAQTFHSKYLTIWQKQRAAGGAGEWRFVVDGGNAAPAPER